MDIQKPALVLSNPMNIIEFLVFYSPIVLASIILILPTAVGSPKGAIYLALLLGICFLRIFIFQLFNLDPYANDGTVCTMTKYGEYGNSYISVFVISFTLMYLCMPMIINSAANYMVIALLLLYLFVTIGILFYRNCIKSKPQVFINVLLGACMGALIPAFFYMGESQRYLFFNEISNNKDVCSMPSKQTFKCNVYKNGQLIA
uniref:Uncharacterized protein n=1 Tax=viral metagenome TaxID=1070528 RepID=A0A6C0BAV4_9ZZZZ